MFDRQTAADMQQELKLPEVLGELCVHSHLEQASCRACVQVCPQQAWVIDDDMLGIDTDRCDGCDLCVPVCPQGAIQPNLKPLVKETANGIVAFALCEHAGLVGETRGLMACLHSLAVTDLLKLYKRGVTYLLSTCGDCANCQRGKAERLQQRLQGVNELLRSRDLAELTYRELSPGHWLRALDRVEDLSRNRGINRRAFFRRAMKQPSDRVRGILEEDPAFHPPGSLLPAGGEQTLFPHVPVFDPDRCTACHACINLCPHKALVFDQNGPAYDIDPALCSDCGICTDVCEQAAIEVQSMQPVTQLRVDLQALRCRACGVEFHVTNGVKGHGSFCRVCRKTNHSANLYQVLD